MHVVVGVEVEVVVPAPQAAPRIPASEDLGALALFHSYAATVGMSQPALDAALDLLRVCPCLPSHGSCREGLYPHIALKPKH